jgi:hypothetical protein
MTYLGINPEFAIKSNLTEQKYPALQVTNYEPKTLKEEINFCFSESSFELLNANGNLFDTEVVKCVYRRELVLMHQIITPVRWIFLNIPPIFLQDKKNKEIFYPEKGVKLLGTNKVTVAKCFLACLSGDNLVLDTNGLPQIFTLKLTSSKTQLIGYQNKEETKTILALNRSLQQEFKTRNNLVHLVSVELKSKPKEFISNHSGDSSLGVIFELSGNAQVLSQNNQEQIFNLVSDEEFQTLFNNPFGLKQAVDRDDNRNENSRVDLQDAELYF